MRMTTAKLLLLRIFNLTLGRFAIFSALLKKILVKIFVKDSKDKYFASSKYFSWKDIDDI